MSILNKYTASESKLQYYIEFFRKAKIMSIIEIINNSKLSHPNDIWNYQEKLVDIINKNSNSFFSIKLSSFGYYIKDITINIHHILRDICECKCKLIIQAEDYNTNLKHKSIINDLLIRYNKYNCCIYKTYQMYDKNILDELISDIDMCNKKNVWLGIVLVRGSYMKNSASKKHMFKNKQDTHDNYNIASKMILENIVRKTNIDVIFATQNKNSIDLILNNICKNNISTENISFSNYIGYKMDITKFTNFNIKLLRYIPCGPFYKTIPYLIKRYYNNL